MRDHSLSPSEEPTNGTQSTKNARDSDQGLKSESRKNSVGWVEVGSQKIQSSCCQRQTLGFVGSCKRNDSFCAVLLVVDLRLNWREHFEYPPGFLKWQSACEQSKMTWSSVRLGTNGLYQKL